MSDLIPYGNEVKDVMSSNSAFMAFMRKHKVATVNVEFDGNGDSGQITGTYAMDDKGVDLDSSVLKLPVGKIKFLRSYSLVDGKMVPNYDIKEGTVEDLLEEVAYSMLEKKHGGWEINEGSYGTFTFDFVNGNIELEYNERVETVNTTNFMFDLFGHEIEGQDEKD